MRRVMYVSSPEMYVLSPETYVSFQEVFNIIQK